MTKVTLRTRVWQIVAVAHKGDIPSYIFDWSILTLILISVLTVMLDTNPEISAEYHQLFRTIEILTTLMFSIEYLLRLWSCATRTMYRGNIKGRLKWMTTPLAIIDLIAILPFYLTLFGLDPDLAHMLSLIRILRIIKLVRYSTSIKMIHNVWRYSRHELFIAAVLIIVITIVSSALMYFAEHRVQPENFRDILTTMWWTVMTITNVGYGDVVPVTGFGQFIGSVVAILGIAVFALPTAILGASFMREIQNRRKPAYDSCPHCGEKLQVQQVYRRRGVDAP